MTEKEETQEAKSRITALTMQRMKEGRRLVARKGWNYAMLGRKWKVSRERARKIVVIGGPIRKFEDVQEVNELPSGEVAE